MILERAKTCRPFLLKYFFIFVFTVIVNNFMHEFKVIVHFGQWKTVPSCVPLHYFYILIVTVLKFENLLNIRMSYVYL